MSGGSAVAHDAGIVGMGAEPQLKSRLARKTIVLLLGLVLFNAALLSALSFLLIGIEQHWMSVDAADAMRLTKTALIAGLAGNAILGAFFVAYFRKQITGRLEALLRNIDAARHGGGFAPVEGDDEIATVDSNFRILADSLREMAEKERAILDYASDVICCFDLSGACISVNLSCQRLWGYRPEELIGQNVFDLVAQSDRQRLAGNVRSVYGKPGPASYELKIERKDGSFADTSWSLYWSSERSWIVAVIHDITERKNQERAQAEFTAMVSHDLRSPLATVQMFLQSVEMQLWGSVSEQYRQQSLKSRQLLDHLLTVTEDLLTYEKAAATDITLERKPIELSAVIEQALFAVSGMATKREIAIDAAPCRIKFVADAERLTQVLVNLLSNAIKFSPRGGRVSIFATEDETFAIIQVADRGPGISDEEKGRIFDKFAQAQSEQAKAGTGLGLAICKMIVERHGGRIGVSDAQGGGSLFWVKIPKSPV